MKHIIIIGAGHAGVRAAMSARQLGFDGLITMIADEGLATPYERPPLSKWSDTDTSLAVPIYPGDQLDEANIERVEGKVSSIESDLHEITLQDGTKFRYSKLLIATGASARKLPAELDGGSDVKYLRNLDDAAALRASAKNASSAVIIGGGFIGLELAASLRSLGIKVQVLEASDKLLARAVSTEVAQVVQDLHTKNNVEFIFNAQIESITKEGEVSLVGGPKLQADLIVVGIGSEVDTSMAVDAGLNCYNAIIVDKYLRTSDPDIYAAGDCCCFPLYGSSNQMTRLESWRTAGEQGELAGQNMVTETSDAYVQTPWFWSEQYDHVLQVIGLKPKQAEIVERSYASSHCISFGMTSSGELAFACGIAPSTKIAKDIRFAGKLIDAKTNVSSKELSDPSISLKKLMKNG